MRRWRRREIVGLVPGVDRLRWIVRVVSEWVVLVGSLGAESGAAGGFDGFFDDRGSDGVFQGDEIQAGIRTSVFFRFGRDAYDPRYLD